MDDFKQALSLVKFEFKQSIVHFLFFILLLFGTQVIMQSIIPDYLENSSMGLDFLFLIAFTVLSQMTKPSSFQMQDRGNGLWASPFIVNLNHLPIKQETIVTYRFTVYFILHGLFTCILLWELYPAFSEHLTISTYIVFAIIWFCFGLYVGPINLIFEPGTNLFILIISFVFIILPIIFFLDLFVFYVWYKDGLVNWTIKIASSHPIISTSLSLLLAVVGWKFWKKKMLQRMQKIDYL